MSGNAISRAVRVHLLLDAVLNGLLLSKSMDVPLPCAAGVEQDDAESSLKLLETSGKVVTFQESLLLVNASFRRRHVSFVWLLLATAPISWAG